MWLFRWLATLEVHEWVSLARLALILIVGSIVVWEVYGPSWRKAKPSVPRPMARCPHCGCLVRVLRLEGHIAKCPKHKTRSGG
jgi:hypothetical protein